MKFPYQPYLVAPSPTLGSVLYRPEVPLRLIGSAGEAFLLAPGGHRLGRNPEERAM